MNSTAQAWEIAREIAAKQGTGSKEWYGLAHLILTLPQRIEPTVEENEMNELIPLQTTDFNGEQTRTVNARDLHVFLGVQSEFRNWIKNRIEQFDFVQDVDFIAGNFLPGSERIDYHLTISMAKELAMVERSAKGKEARLYFIECERIALQAKAPAPVFDIPQTYASALQLAANQARQLEQQNKTIAVMTPKADFHDRVAQSDDLLTVREAAKVLRTGERRLFAFMRNEGLLMANNLPYQPYLDRGLFRVVESPWRDHLGNARISLKTCVTQKGMVFLQGLQDRLAMYQESAA